jgi:hypothetical protein
MTSNRLLAAAFAAALSISTLAAADDQTVPGAGNAAADALAASSPRVREAHQFLVVQAGKIKNAALRNATLDLLPPLALGLPA